MDSLAAVDLRNAFLQGVEEVVRRVERMGNHSMTILLRQTAWLNVALYHFPDPTSHLIREVVDPHLDEIRWRVYDGVLEASVNFSDWKPATEAVAVSVTRPRALLWADLYARPEEGDLL